MRRMTRREKDIARAKGRAARAEAAYQKMMRRNELKARVQEAKEAGR